MCVQCIKYHNTCQIDTKSACNPYTQTNTDISSLSRSEISSNHLFNDSRSVYTHIGFSVVESNHQIIGVVRKTLQVQTNHR